jgi:hypothetical protein
VDKFMVHGKKERKKEKNKKKNKNNNNNKKRVGVTIESYGKVEISYINVDNF